MRNLVKIFFVSVLFVGCKTDKKVKNDTTHQHHKVEKKTEVKKKTLSPHTSTMAMIGDAHIHIDYSSPGVRDRIIFGGLLAYDMIWQAGAHKATWLETNKDLNIDGKVLPAGKYGFFVIPSKNEWTLIFNRNWDQHGKDEYDDKDDVLRFKTVPQVLEQVTEHLKYKVAKTSNNTGTISLSWEKVLVKFTFEITK
tara:strand:+ start:9357 stop:9941 length:585 start_codon:yes stop_codon:yes gene_type:complete